MTLDDLLQPTTEDPPCGPDLDQADDPAFVDYYYEAVARLPERYFVPGSVEDGREDRLFDPRSVELPAERSAILALLARSRDLRLLSLLAQFQALAMRLGDFVDTLEIVAAMLAQWPDELHPQPSRGRADRRAAVEALASPTTVAMPLTHLCLLGRNDVSLRRHLVATGRAASRLSEGDLQGQDVLAPLRGEAMARQVAASHELIGRALDATTAITRHSAAGPDGFTPDLSALRQVLGDLQAMIVQARPERRPWTERPPAAAAPDPVTAPAPPQPASAGAPPARPEGAIPDRATAEAALSRAQDWLSRHEPSSAALPLVVQARQLVGLPLVQAIEALMPDRAASVALHLGQGSGFVLPMARLRELTALALPEEKPAAPSASPLQPIATRVEMVGLLQAAETFFLQHEPASPIPLILSKCRAVLDQNFSAIMLELLPHEGAKL